MKVATVRPVGGSLLLQLLERSGVHNTRRIYLRRGRQSRWYLVWNLKSGHGRWKLHLHLVERESIRERDEQADSLVEHLRYHLAGSIFSTVHLNRMGNYSSSQ